MYNLSYSKFIAKLRIKNIIINRKFLSDLSINYPDYFNEIINMIK